MRKVLWKMRRGKYELDGYPTSWPEYLNNNYRPCFGGDYNYKEATSTNKNLTSHPLTLVRPGHLFQTPIANTVVAKEHPMARHYSLPWAESVWAMIYTRAHAPPWPGLGPRYGHDFPRDKRQTRSQRAWAQSLL